MKNPLSYEESLDKVVSYTRKNIRDFLSERDHNMVCEAFGTHEGFMAEICAGGDRYYLKLVFNESKEDIFMEVVPLYRVREKDLKNVLKYANSRTCDTIIGRITVSGNIIVAHSSISLETFARDLAAFSGTSGVTARMIELAAPFFAPDKKQFEIVERILMTTLVSMKASLSKLCAGEEVSEEEDPLLRLMGRMGRRRRSPSDLNSLAEHLRKCLEDKDHDDDDDEKTDRPGDEDDGGMTVHLADAEDDDDDDDDFDIDAFEPDAFGIGDGYDPDIDDWGDGEPFGDFEDFIASFDDDSDDDRSGDEA